MLPRGIEPARDLWPRHRGAARTAHRGPGGWRWPWLAAAAVLLVVGSSLITASLLRREPAAIAQAPVARPEAAVTRCARSVPARRSTRPTMPSASSWRIACGAHRPLAARQRAAKLEANLAELHRASAEINAALELESRRPVARGTADQCLPGRTRGARERQPADRPRMVAGDDDEASTRMPL